MNGLEGQTARPTSLDLGKDRRFFHGSVGETGVDPCDAFDGVMRHARWLAHLGEWSYVLLLKINRWFNAIRQRMGLPYWSMSQYIKHKVKNAVSFISDFEHVMTDQARKRGCDGVVCGHIHKAEVRDIDGILYCNDGDWVESLTALVETYEGELKLVHWRGRVHAPLNLGRFLEVTRDPSEAFS